MNDEILTLDELATRWKVSKKTITRYVADGKIKPCKNLPSNRFSLNQILQLEGYEMDRFSPIERRRMQQRIDELEKRVDDYEKAFLGIERLVLNKKINNFPIGGQA